MSVIVNPFLGNGYSLAEMTQAISILPNRYGRIGEMGLFTPESISQRNVIIESVEGELRLLPATKPGAPATVGSNDVRSMRSFIVPHIPYNDVLLPEEVQGIRGFGLSANEDPMANIMARKLMKMRAKHAQTLEYMRANALKGITKDGAGNTIYDWHAEFGIEKTSVDFDFGNANQNLLTVCTEIARHIEANLKGETMSGVHALVSPEFFDKLISHKSVKDAYTFYQNSVNPMRDDVRRGFRFGSILFEEYFGSVTLADGSTQRLIEAQEAIAFPLGTTDTFKTYLAPANLMETIGTYGQELYAYQITRQNGTGIDIYSQSNPLPMVKRPALTVRLFSSTGF